MTHFAAAVPAQGAREKIYDTHTSQRLCRREGAETKEMTLKLRSGRPAEGGFQFSAPGPVFSFQFSAPGPGFRFQLSAPGPGFRFQLSIIGARNRKTETEK